MDTSKAHSQDGAEPKANDIYRHRRRGSSYEVVGPATLQTDRPLGDNEKLIVYRGKDGQLWVRAVNEFKDGRFERI